MEFYYYMKGKLSPANLAGQEKRCRYRFRREKIERGATRMGSYLRGGSQLIQCRLVVRGGTRKGNRSSHEKIPPGAGGGRSHPAEKECLRGVSDYEKTGCIWDKVSDGKPNQKMAGSGRKKKIVRAQLSREKQPRR